MRTFLKLTPFVVAFALAACQQKAPAKTTATAFANTNDYICGMAVQPDYTDTCHYKGKVYAFCSESCRDEFKQKPEQFLNQPQQ